MEEPATSSTKKRAAEEPSSVSITATTAISNDEGGVGEPCSKKPRLSKKEMLLQAKARLQEAKEKQKSLLQTLEQQKLQEREQSLGTEDSSSYNNNNNDYYYDQYHVPPVTGATDSLLVTNISSTGPPEKVRFIEQSQGAIEDLLKMIQSRKRGRSPTPSSNNGAATATATAANWNPHHPYNQNNFHHNNNNNNNNASTTIRERSTTKNTNNNPLPPLREHRNNNHPPGETKRQERELEGHHRLPSNRGMISNGGGGHQLPDRPLASDRDKKRAAKEMPNRQQQQQGPPISRQLKPPKRPWKRAFAQITGKTLDCTLDLPSNSSYLIRTQDRSVVTRVQFFSAPDNTSLLEQPRNKSNNNKKSKPMLQEHLSQIQKLPCNSSFAWKGVDILLFLQNQDQRNQKRTYQPPARRNLPLSHWAILDLEQPFLPPDQQPLGHFTATLQPPSSRDNNNKTNNDIHFAGKLVWNMTPEHNNNSHGNAGSASSGKISKSGEVIAAVPTSGIRNCAMVLTVQGFFELAAATATADSSLSSFPVSLRGRKVMLPTSKSVGFILGSSDHGAAAAEGSTSTKNANNNSNNTMKGACQVLFPNGMASGPSSAQALMGARAVLYD